jgi:hypothetical protein
MNHLGVMAAGLDPTGHYAMKDHAVVEAAIDVFQEIRD